jgi:nucleoside-diphosphate-sugar epimerase
VPNSYERPLHVFDVNCFGAIKVINAAQEAGCEAVLQVSSAEVYGAGQSGNADEPGMSVIALKESAAVVPHSSYGASKAAVDAYCQVAWRERQTPVIALRQFNCVGARETHPYVVPEIVGQLARSGPAAVPVVKLGNNSSRDFIWAGDAVRLAVQLLERGAFGEVYNLGSEESIKVYDLAARISRLMGFAEVRVEQDPARVRPWEIWFLRADNSKLLSALGQTDGLVGLKKLDDALSLAVNWYVEQGRRWPWEK